MGIIYQAKNLLNGKVYIGQTTYSLTCRKKSHEAESVRRSGYYFHSALRKYGFESFEWTILHEGDFDSQDLDVLERNAIRYLKSTDPEKGYNISEGGSTRPPGWRHTEESLRKLKGRRAPNLGVPHTEETRKKLSHAARNRSPEVRQRMSKAQIGKKHGPNKNFLGKRHSEESKQRMRDAAKVIQNRPDVRERKSVSIRLALQKKPQRKKTEAEKENLRAKMKAAWDDPVYVEKVMKARELARLRKLERGAVK